MPKTYRVGETEYQFPDNFTDEQAQRILTEQGVIKAAPQSMSDKLGLVNPMGRQFVDALEGAGAGALSTVRGLSQIARGLGAPIPEVPESLTQAPNSFAGKVGKFGEQTAEFALPIGAAGKAAKAANAGRFGRAAAEGLTSGVVAAAQTGGDKTATGIATVAGAAAPLIGETLQKAFQVYAKSGAPLSPARLYQGALKPPPGSAKQGVEDIRRMVQTGLKEEIPVSGEGLEKLRFTADEINRLISERIKELGAQGRQVDPRVVARQVRGLLQEFNSVNPNASRADILGSAREYIAKHTTTAPYTKIRPGIEEETGRFVAEGTGKTKLVQPYSVAEAQAEKVATYKDLRTRFGQRSGASDETQKALARGLREEIGKAFPEVHGMNDREGALIQLEAALVRALKRDANREAATFNAWHSVARLFEAPEVKSRVAIWLAKAGSKAPMTDAAKRLAGIKGVLQEALVPSQSSAQPSPAAAQ